MKKSMRPPARHMATPHARSGITLRPAAKARAVTAKIPATAKPVISKKPATAKPGAKAAWRAKSLPALRGARPAALWLLVPFALLLILSLLLIGLRVSVGQLAKKNSDLELQSVQLQEENNRYLARAEQLASYSRISRLAHERLGLIGLAPKLIVVSAE